MRPGGLLGANAIEEGTRRLVVRVLRDELAGERALEDRAPELLRAFERPVDRRMRRVDDRELPPDVGHDPPLLFEGDAGTGNDFSVRKLMDARLVVCLPFFSNQLRPNVLP